MALGFGRRVRRRRGGLIEVRLAPEERELIANVLGQLREAIATDTDDPALRRLFPPAYVGDEEKEAGYQALARDELLESRLQSIEAMERTVELDALDTAQATGWLQSMNALRLVLGTRLDVAEEVEPDVTPDDPDYLAWALYYLLSELVQELVDALAPDLPPASADEPDLL